MELETELAVFQHEKERLIREGHENRYVLIHGDKIDSIWDTQKDAIQAGYMRFGLPPRLATKISVLPREPIFPFSIPCC